MLGSNDETRLTTMQLPKRREFWSDYLLTRLQNSGSPTTKRKTLEHRIQDRGCLTLMSTGIGEILFVVCCGSPELVSPQRDFIKSKLTAKNIVGCGKTVLRYDYPSYGSIP